MFRTKGEKLTSLANTDRFKSVFILSRLLNAKLYLINDVKEENKIYIKDLNSIIYYEIKADSFNGWNEVYKKLNLL